MQDETTFIDRLLAMQHSLDGGTAKLEIDPNEALRFYLPLARTILDLPQQSARRIVAIAGLPGSGKTAFTLTLALVINALAVNSLAASALTSIPVAAAVGMDGWHYSNAYLESHSITHAGEITSLRSIKGMPETFDVLAIAAFLRKARSGETDLPYPVYSRKVHDPIPGGLLTASIQVILIEGNYLLLNEEPWRSLADFYDLRILITGEIEAFLPGLIERHRRGGKTDDLIEAWLKNVDIPNMHRIKAGSVAADITIHKINSRRIEKVEYHHPKNGVE
ncbi:MAG TPA: hypothetical protein VIO61_05530 [Anaerolineaceae bacterium]